MDVINGADVVFVPVLCTTMQGVMKKIYINETINKNCAFC